PGSVGILAVQREEDVNRRFSLPSPSIWALSRIIHATTSFDAAVAVPGEIYSRAMNSLPHRNSVDAFSETRQTEWFLSARATRHSKLGSTADNFSHTDRRRGSRIARRERALLVRARRPAAAPLHAPAPVARESRSSVFVPVAPNANRRAPAKRWIVR